MPDEITALESVQQPAQQQQQVAAGDAGALIDILEIHGQCLGYPITYRMPIAPGSWNEADLFQSTIASLEVMGLSKADQLAPRAGGGASAVAGNDGGCPAHGRSKEKAAWAPQGRQPATRFECGASSPTPQDWSRPNPSNTRTGGMVYFCKHAWN